MLCALQLITSVLGQRRNVHILKRRADRGVSKCVEKSRPKSSEFTYFKYKLVVYFMKFAILKFK